MTEHGLDSRSSAMTPHRSKSLFSRVCAGLRQAWRPVPPALPEVDPHLEDLPTLERMAEVVRYNMLVVEQAVSPAGGLRAWLKLNVLIAFLLAIPALLVVPLITYLLGSFATWTEFLVRSAENLLRAAVMIFFLIILIVFTPRIVMMLLNRGR